MYKKLICSALIVCSARISFAGTTTLNCGRMIDVTTQTVRKQVSIKIRNKKVVSLKNGFSKNKKAIDLKNKTCLPGLIDLHVHLEQHFPNMLGFHHPDEARMMIDAMGFAKLNLMAGFTTIRDLASIRNIPAQVRYAINTGKLIGPRVINVGHPISAKGGHGDFFSKLSVEGRPDARKKYQDYYDFHFINQISDVAPWFENQFYKRPKWYRSFKAVGKNEDLAPDAVKIMATGGVVSDDPESHKPQLSFEIIREIVKYAKLQSEKTKKPISVTAHAHGLEGIANTVFAGAGSVEHATELFVDIDSKDKSNLKRASLRKRVQQAMRANKIYMVPTLLAAETVVRYAKKGKLPKHISKKAIRVGRKMKSNFKQAVEANIPIAFGSDTGISAHGENWKEFLLMVRGGMSPLESLTAATLSGAAVLRMQDQIGSIEPGKLADIIAVEGKPDQNIGDIRNVDFVMKEGVVYKK